MIFHISCRPRHKHTIHICFIFLSSFLPRAAKFCCFSSNSHISHGFFHWRMYECWRMDVKWRILSQRRHRPWRAQKSSTVQLSKQHHPKKKGKSIKREKSPSLKLFFYHIFCSSLTSLWWCCCPDCVYFVWKEQPANEIRGKATEVEWMKKIWRFVMVWLG